MSDRPFRRQKAVLLPFAGVDDYNETLVSAGVELEVRWVNRETQMTNAQGKQVSVDATVIVGRDVVVDEGSLMWEGTLQAFGELDLAGTGGDNDVGIMEVVAVATTPDIKGRFFRRKLGLSWYKDVVNYA